VFLIQFQAHRLSGCPPDRPVCLQTRLLLLPAVKALIAC
jgi:hypothetical protein